MKDGKAWGRGENDGGSQSEGWMYPEYAEIHDPEFCKKPTDVTWQDSPYTEELKTAKLVHVERTTTVRYV